MVEDNLSDVLLIREAITAAEIAADVHVVRDGQEATEFVDAADAGGDAPCPDIVLLDLNLPRKRGDAVLRYIRRSRTCRSVAVLIITSSDSVQDRELFTALGAMGYFHKPSDYDEFMKLGVLVRHLLA